MEPQCSSSSEFQSTLPVRGATAPRVPVDHLQVISIHAPREGSDSWKQLRELRPGDISIHAPREGSDLHLRHAAQDRRDISIHAPREGSDMVLVLWIMRDFSFQSTLPVRGATKP